jgi:transposase
MEKIYNRSAGLDVHKDVVVCTILINEGSTLRNEVRQFSTFLRDLRKLASWLKSEKVEIAVMESTSVYWYPVYEALEEEDLPASVVNAFHVKNVPGRKTDQNDSCWLAELAMCGLLRSSLVPIRDLRELRVVSRYRTKLIGMAAAEKNRLAKCLDSAGIKLSSVLSDIDGVTARKLIDVLCSTKEPCSPEVIRSCLPKKGRIKASQQELQRACEGRLSDRHRHVLGSICRHLDYIHYEIMMIDAQIVGGMAPYKEQYELLQTLPGVDSHSAAILLIETGGDISKFKNAKHFCAWAGVSPGNNESAGKKNTQRHAKRTVTYGKQCAR